MNIYRKVLLELVKDEKWATKYNNLQKLRFSTEDEVLISLLVEYCNMIKDISSYIQRKLFQHAQNLIGESLTVRVKLDNYCNEVIRSQKPEWQIMAERNGWAKVR